jgi:thiamine monophosphate kinase
LDPEKIPCMEGVTPLQAVRAGEEYEIAVTAPEIDVEQFTEEFGLRLTWIGRVVAGRPGVTLLREGESIPIPPGFDHFRKK